tara:strand:- start:1871 stop:3208 length:1338 start_codon:yes stop_codon:yes gene_type:complete
MASLTGQQIQNSYEGLLKTENSGPLTVGETNITDGVGTQTGLYTNSQYGIAGYKGVNQFPQWGIKNTGFDVTASPMGGSGVTQLSFLDINDFKTALIAQNRFGGIQYTNYVDGQSHIFTGTNQNSPIRMDSFNSPNNSDNWYTAYLDNINQVNLSGTDLEIIKRDGSVVDTTDLSSLVGAGTTYNLTSQQSGSDVLVNLTGSDASLDVVSLVAGTNITLTDNGSNNVTIDAAGGGGTSVKNLSNTRVISNGYANSIGWKMTHMTNGYSTANYTITSPTEFMVVPFTEEEGFILDNLSFSVGTGVAGATTNIHLYKGNVTTVSIGGGLTQDVLDGTFVADLALNVDVSTSGQKFISGINQTLPAAEDSLYFFLYRMANGTGVNMHGISNTQTINPNNSIFLSGGIPYRIVTWQSGGGSSAPTNLDLDSMSPSTGSGLIRTFYTIEA